MTALMETAGLRDTPDVQTAAGEQRIELPAIDNATELLADQTLKLPPEIIEGVLHQGLKGVLGSNSKARKTWILLDAAISVATGQTFWKWRTCKGRVLYINFEIPRAFIRKRIQNICEHRGISDVSNLDVWTLRGYGTALGLLLAPLFAKIETGKYLLIIIDPIYKCLGGRDENSAGDIGLLCNELEQIAVKTAAAVLYAAHFSKGNQAGKEAIDRISGSGVWTRDADSIITLTKHKEEGAYTVDLTLRNLPEQPPFVVQWDFPIMIERTEMLPSDLKQAKASKIKPKPTEHEFLSIFRETTNNPRGCLLTATELRGKFRERGWDEAYAPAMRDECEGAGKVKVNHGAHNQILTGLPGMVEAYRKQQTESCTILAQDPLPTKSKGTRRRK